MNFPWTLQKYIFREMGKTFLLTAVALTGVLGLGGGVMEMIELGEVTTGQLVRLMGLVLPVAAALTLPIAALFSAAATYGRLSADNEFVACRSSGINLHVLFLPTVVLSCASAIVTFVFVNFLIPGMVRNLDEFVAGDVGTWIERRLNSPRGITLKKYRISADDTIVDATEPNSVALSRVAFAELDGEEWVRYGTARQVQLRLDRSAGSLQASGLMSGLSFYDRRSARFANAAEQVIPVNEFSTAGLLAPQIKFLNLFELFEYGAQPQRWHEVADAVVDLRGGIGRRMVYDVVIADGAQDGRIVLADGPTRWSITASRTERLPRDGGVEFTDATIEEERDGNRRVFAAQRADFDITKADTLEESGIRVEAFEVRVLDGPTTVNRAKESLGPFPIPAEIVQRVRSLGEAELLAAGIAGVKGEPLFDGVERVRSVLDRTVRRIRATISERAAFSLSVFALVILGAALGIVFRGSHVVVAFGISFLPSLLVILTIVTGRQMACNAGTHLPGLALMWSGLVAVALLDWWALVKWVRR